jgi:hypothetical protein
MLDKIISEFCIKNSISVYQFVGKERINGYLDLSSLTSIPDGFCPTVGGDLDLSSLTSIPDGFNPTVGDSLYLRSLTSIPDGFNPTVGGCLFLTSLTSKERVICKTPPSVLSWQDGKYIKADGMFAEALRHKGNVWHLKKIGHSEIPFFLVTDGTHYAHGASVKEARESLTYKITDRDTSKYQGMTLETVLPFAEMVRCYRTITGACELGVRDFIARKMTEHKDAYSVLEIVKATAGEYGSESFAKFFGVKVGL